VPARRAARKSPVCGPEPILNIPRFLRNFFRLFALIEYTNYCLILLKEFLSIIEK
jgi:hypothetical protein